jgi:hypothetical protein
MSKLFFCYCIQINLFILSLFCVELYEDPRFVYDVDEDIAAQRQYVLHVFPYYLRGKCREVSRASASAGGAIRNVHLQGPQGRFRTGYFAGSRAADQTRYVSSREIVQD